jgi:cytidylate kinase
MHRWSLALDAIDRDEANLGEEVSEKLHPFIAISREAGAGATEIVSRLADRLQCDVVDRAMLDYMAERYKIPRDMLEVVDERVCHWATEVVRMWLAHRMVSQSDYLLLLGRFVLMAAHSASTIFVGRGAHFILPREKGLAVRIVAPAQVRIKRIMKRQELSRTEAERYAKKRDADRAQFIQRSFQHDVSDPLMYDLIINTEFVDFDSATEIIVSQWQRRFGGTTGE